MHNVCDSLDCFFECRRISERTQVDELQPVSVLRVRSEPIPKLALLAQRKSDFEILSMSQQGQYDRTSEPSGTASNEYQRRRCFGLRHVDLVPEDLVDFLIDRFQ